MFGLRKSEYFSLQIWPKHPVKCSVGLLILWLSSDYAFIYSIRTHCSINGAWVAQWVKSLDLTTHTSLSPIRLGFAPSFVNYQKGALDSQPQVIKLTSCLPSVGGSLRVLRLPPPLKLSPWYSWNIAENGVKHQNSFIHTFLSKQSIPLLL